MKLKDFDYYLPTELIAQTPILERSSSRLMVVNINKRSIEHKTFESILDYLHEGDVLVRNNTKVIPARLKGIKRDTLAKIEILILRFENDICECIVKNSKAVKLNTEIIFNDSKLIAVCIGVHENGLRTFKMHFQGNFLEILAQIGEVPLPPYIKSKVNDPQRYQTVYAQIDGSAAAPTAGFHFTDELLTRIQEKGIIITDITLHVGLGTFKPVEVENIDEHKMHHEMYWMSQETADILNQAKENNRRIICVGTTSARTLETVLNNHHQFVETSGMTDIFIYPGYKFQAMDALITNFHLPKSTLLMMISAFASKELVFHAYQQAIEHHYRFFSFGDSMLLYRGD